MARWWETESGAAFPHADRLLLLIDAEGSNGWRPRQWKYQLQAQLSDRCRLTITLRHIRRAARRGIRLSITGSALSACMAEATPCARGRLDTYVAVTDHRDGNPLRTWEAMRGSIRGIIISTGVEVHAFLHVEM